MPRPSFRNAKNIQANLRIDPSSLAEHNRKLKRLAEAARREVIMAALQAGGMIVHDAAEAKAPGPHIEIEVMTGAELARKWKSAGAQGIKPEGIYAAIGPDAQHWYYRFSEFGVKAHGVKHRKRTRFQQFSAKNKVKRSNMRSTATGQSRRVGNMRPAMVFSIDGQLIFTRKVRGFAAKPFLRPAADSKGPAAVKAMGEILKTEIEKAARS